MISGTHELLNVRRKTGCNPSNLVKMAKYNALQQSKFSSATNLKNVNERDYYAGP